VQIVATFSIVAFDPNTGELGIAVESKFLGVGAVVPWAKAGVGAVATQAYANTTYGPKGLELLEQGLSAQEVVDKLTADDPEAQRRQVGIVDAQGRSATFTGAECFAWAGGRAGQNYACQGNILVSQATVDAMASSFEANTSLPLPERLVSALQAGQSAGGDSRGEQSAALLVVKDKGGYSGFNDRYIHLHVEDHPKPIDELERVLALHRVYFASTRTDAELIRIDAILTSEIQTQLSALGIYQGDITGIYDNATRKALENFASRENLEERWRGDYLVDKIILDFLRGATH
jgi:uncharacterized Ntn-hydrolase superfamily protein